MLYLILNPKDCSKRFNPLVFALRFSAHIQLCTSGRLNKWLFLVATGVAWQVCLLADVGLLILFSGKLKFK
ncbi:hypothetical protein HMI54_007351 [Coelomomyces lativittatus]|nr:hypothetical protein HMI54_007351 [Coelomomyces lativittatus]